ncbi:hypothetical protein [Antrihabitans stalactiti]|uniref:Uncharacterized protein n=1 Tax=Antrihabitans stalactiti TaxID=2584121 RepID=A0A848KIY9_9NOCA|nr:hypothetical protein [Antrihabitans stalactiti]NMN95847.1 hypothetical protein [Antrihabitans stalactiti]
MDHTDNTHPLHCSYCDRRFATDRRDLRADAHVNGWVVTAELTICPACANAHANTRSEAGRHPNEQPTPRSDNTDLGTTTRTE